MAITPRTILTSAAPATVAVVSLYFFTVLGTSLFTCMTNSDDDRVEVVTFSEPSSADTEDLYRSSACDHVAERFGVDKSDWSEFAWVNFAYCFDQESDSKMVINTAREGLNHHPRSEVLYNLKGYHQIVLEKHVEAIDTLRRGMDNVSHHRNGVMSNNLAWAGLWAPREMHLDEARHLYVRSLAMSPNSCETIHTGLFVEFAQANQGSNALERYEALKRFGDLRNRYNRCLDRLEDGKWLTVVEIVGAAVLFDNVDNTANSNEVHPLMRSATSTLVAEHPDASIDQLCREAMPLAEFHHDCVESVEDSLEAAELIRQNHKERNQRASQVKEEIVEQFGEDYPILKANDRDRSSGCGAVLQGRSQDGERPQIDLYIR